MKTLGMVGGLGPESTIDYYRSIISLYRERTGGEGYPPIVIVSLEVDSGIRMLDANHLEQLAGACMLRHTSSPCRAQVSSAA